MWFDWKTDILIKRINMVKQAKIWTSWMSFIVLWTISSYISNVNSLKNGLALTPPMGWITWVRFTCESDCETWPNDCINDDLIRQMAHKLYTEDYARLGYKYINIDDCWSNLERDQATQKLVPDNKRFGGNEGMIALRKFVESKGLMLGTYGDCGTKTCAGYPAQLKSEQNYEDNYFELDAATLKEWGIRSFKFDGCNIDPFKAESICPKMAKALERKDFSTLLICEWPVYMLRKDPTANVNWTLAQQACNTFRYYEDVEDSWTSILSIVDFTIKLQQTILKYHGPGHWFDPDQLVIGNYGLSLEQARAQMAIWSIWAAPLYMSNDLRYIDPQMALVLKNKNLINVNQDKLGVFGMMVAQKVIDWNGKIQAFVKPIEPIIDGCPSFAIVYLNRVALGNGNWVSFKLRDLINQKTQIELAAQRYQQLARDPNGPPPEQFIASECLKKLTKAMTRDPRSVSSDQVVINPAGQKSSPYLEDQSIYFRVVDLITGDTIRDRLALDSDLSLFVNPSSVQAVRLQQTYEIPYENIQ